MKILLLFVVLLLFVLVPSSTYSQIGGGLDINICTWSIETDNEVELSASTFIPQDIRNNVLVVNFITLDIVATDSLRIPIITDETDLSGLQLSEDLINLHETTGGSCTWIEDWLTEYTHDGTPTKNEFLATTVILDQITNFTMSSRVWRNPNRYDDTNTLRPSIIK